MAYISSEEVKEIRNRIKKEFPNYKFSITRQHYSTLDIRILQADLDPVNDNGDSFINRFYIRESWETNPKTRDTLLKIDEIVNSVKQWVDRNAGDMSADYGDSNFFYYIYFGSWDKPYERIA